MTDVPVNHGFGIGDVVNLKSGGQRMTVSAFGAPSAAHENWFKRDHGDKPVATSNAEVECVWIDSIGHPHIAGFAANLLQKTD